MENGGVGLIGPFGGLNPVLCIFQILLPNMAKSGVSNCKQSFVKQNAAQNAFPHFQSIHQLIIRHFAFLAPLKSPQYLLTKMLSGAEHRIAPSFPIKEEKDASAFSSKSSTPANPIDELANIASSSAAFKINSTNNSSKAPPTIPTSTFTHFSAAQLFGLFEKGFEQQNKMDIMPTQNDKRSNSNENSSATNFRFPMFFGNDNSIPASAAGSAILPAATPIDQLLQISQQILNDGIAKQTIQGNMNNSNNNMNGNGKKSSKGNGEEKAGGGKQQGESSERKRSYPYTFQFCVLCQKNVHSSKLPCHIRQCHVGKPMFQCPVCDFTSTYSKNNVKSHMVSLHGLAGDPISYMDQYASQVEDFMKKCFPNVRGRGRPIHGRLSPSSAKQQLLMSPTSTMASGSSNADISFDNIEMTPLPVQQQRRHSTVAALFPPTNNPNQTPQRGRQKGKTATNNKNNNGNGMAGIEMAAVGNGNNRPNGCAVNSSFPIGDLYTAPIGMGKVQKEQQNQQINIFDKITFPPNICFNPAPNFNPFNLYLQHLNGLFPNAFNGNSIEDMKNLQSDNNSDHYSKAEEIEAVNDLMQETTGTAFLEECLNLSQKFLREMGENNEQIERRGDCNLENAKMMIGIGNSNICHSSSSTTSPPSLSSSIPNYASHQPPILDFNADEPRYFPHSFQWPILDGPALEKTVFSTFSNANGIIEKFDLTLFESLMSAPNCANANGSLLTSAQKEKIAGIRSQIKLQSFEIMFALHRLDQNILKPEQIHLVMQIAPTNADIRRFALFDQSNSSLDRDEQFIIELSKIDRLNEKLATMEFAGGFDRRAMEINQQLQNLSHGAKLLFNSAHFHTILHLLLISINLVGGDFTVQLVKGFFPSRILQMCNFRFPDGTLLLEVLANIIKKHFPDLLQFVDQSKKAIEEASKIEFFRIIDEFHSLEKGQTLVEEELVMVGDDGKNLRLANFLAQCSMECANLKETIQSTKTQLLSTMEFFGEFCGHASIHGRQEEQFRPERFFSVIAQFFDGLQNAVNS